VQPSCMFDIYQHFEALWRNFGLSNSAKCHEGILKLISLSTIFSNSIAFKTLNKIYIITCSMKPLCDLLDAFTYVATYVVCRLFIVNGLILILYWNVYALALEFIHCTIESYWKNKNCIGVTVLHDWNFWFHNF